MTTTLHGIRAPGALLALFALGAAACDAGPGSEIGPRLPDGPRGSSMVVVLDDDGRGVAGAIAQVAGRSATTSRNGRADLEADVRGAQLVHVDPTAGAATAGDRLAGYTVALDFVGGDAPEALYVPALPDAASATVPTGVQTAATTVATAAGDELTVALGTNVDAGSAAQVVLRLGTLQAAHLPGRLPTPATSNEAFVWSRGVFVAPADVAFAPPADLSAPDELGVGGSTAVVTLFRLDPTTGAWAPTSATVQVASGRLVAAGAIAAGGLYAFAAPAPAGSVSGRIVDAAATDAAAIADALVRVDHAKTTTDSQGRFRVDGIAVATPAGAARVAAVEAFAGGSWLPALVAVDSPDLVAGDNALADLVLDTRRAKRIAVQDVRRGRADPFLPVRMSALRGGVAVVATSDADGFAVLEDVPTGYAGFLDASVGGTRDVILAQAVRFFDGARWDAIYQFRSDRSWRARGNRTQIRACDDGGGGPLEGVDVVQGSTPGEGRLEETRESGTLSGSRSLQGRATGSHDVTRAGQRVVHAFSIVAPSSDRLELPLQVPRPTSVGAFDRHGLFAGAVVGADPSLDHALRATRRIAAQEWWDDVVDGQPISSVPLDVDPAAVADRYAVGVPTPGGHVAVAEFAATDGAALPTLAKAGFALELAPVEGAVTARDVALDHVADAQFVVADALQGAPAELDVAQLTMALALQQPSGRVVDVVRGLRGNHAAAGDDLVFTLPPLAGELAGHGWLALLDGTFVGGDDVTRRATQLVSLPRGAAPQSLPRGDVRFRAFPTIASPAPAATVTASGFTVQFALPPGALHGFVELRATVAGSPAQTLLWQVAVPPDATEFAFVRLPTNVATPLRAGVAYTLTVSAMFADGPATGTGSDYVNVAGYLHSIGAVERGVTHVVSASIAVTAQ